MRKAFVSTLVELAGDDPRIVLLTADLGFNFLEPFEERFPDRFFNVGVAEQNMIGLATGLAEAGLIPFVYSIVTFATLRPYEFIRNGPVHHRLPVRIVGIGGGVEYGVNGPTHHGLEDIAVMRALPGLTIVAPVDPRQAATALRATATLAGPVYYRLGKDEAGDVPGVNGAFELGRLNVLAEGDDVAIVAVGPVAREAVRAAELLSEAGVSAGVAAVASVSPAPADDLAALLDRVPLVVTVEAHGTTGGLGSLVAEVIAGGGLGCRLTPLGIGGADLESFGSDRFLLEQHGLSAEQVAARIVRELARAEPLPQHG
jgi:transketolase